ncbi:cyclase family protein [Frankia sp. AgB32]|uniref:cyclase family protein n=1 Tax=Frankia sp. AgB32 TaxID=631119 RepID=UPI00200E3AAB|nr:cyclase family protein [Frankia sp. AgB32]MCK9893100.1 cyclase family protein [Frankia sp. AgB32]
MSSSSVEPDPPPGDLIDLSVAITTGMPVYPGDPEVAVEPALRVGVDGVNVQCLRLGSQTGTHVDAPWHVDDGLPRLDELPLERFTGPVALVDARGLAPRAPIGPGALPAGLRAGDVVLIVTGWSRHWGRAEYLDHPYLTAATARAIVDAGVRTVGIDAASVDPTTGPGDHGPAGLAAVAAGAPDGEPGLAAHRVLCGAGAVIVENLTALGGLLDAAAQGRPIEVFLFPLPLAGADGGPVRAVARLGPPPR